MPDFLTAVLIVALVSCLAGGVMFAYIWWMSGSSESGAAAVILLTGSALSALTLLGEGSQR